MAVHGTYWKIGINIDERLVATEVILFFILSPLSDIQIYLLILSFIYKKRVGTSSETVNPEELRESKQTVYSDNFDYLLYLKSYVDNK